MLFRSHADVETISADIDAFTMLVLPKIVGDVRTVLDANTSGPEPTSFVTIVAISDEVSICAAVRYPADP